LPLTSKKTSPSRGRGAASDADMAPMVTPNHRLCPDNGCQSGRGCVGLVAYGGRSGGLVLLLGLPNPDVSAVGHAELVQLRYNYRLYPTPGQRAALARALGCARVVFNDGLRARQEAPAGGLPFVSDGELSARLAV
jgi:hypothetical protein